MLQEQVTSPNQQITLGLTQFGLAVAKIEWQINRVNSNLSDKRMEKLHFPNRPKILIVEDNPTIQMINHEILTTGQFNTEIASNYWEVLKLYQTNNYDLILLDVGLPGRNGLDLCRKIRELEQKTDTHTPIIALTAFGEFVKEDSFKAGVDDFAIKPLLQGELIKFVSKWLPTTKKQSKQETQNE